MVGRRAYHIRRFGVARELLQVALDDRAAACLCPVLRRRRRSSSGLEGLGPREDSSMRLSVGGGRNRASDEE